MVGTVTPTNYSLNIFNTSLTAISGKNNLTLVGTGTQDGSGLLVTNITLTSSGSNINLVVNGDFSFPAVKGYSFLPGTTGWSASEMEIGFAPIYSSVFRQGQLCELDGLSNNAITQLFNITLGSVNPVPVPPVPSSGNQYTLSFQYAARNNLMFSSSQGLVYWNGALVANITPTDYAIRTFTVTVTSVSGTNNLTFAGAGVSDTAGLGIDNVSLVKAGSKINMVLNGGF